MSTLAELVTTLQNEIPAVDSVPTAAQYEQAVRDAVLEFSRRCGLEKVSELAVVAGTATYSLEDDFLKLIALESLANPDGIIVSASGLIPVSATWEERWTIRNRQITFHPTPTYTLTRDYRYKAEWIFNADADPTLVDAGEDEIEIILLRAQEICKQKQANAQAGGIQRYSLGAVSVDNSAGLDGMLKAQTALREAFEAACERYNGMRLAVS